MIATMRHRDFGLLWFAGLFSIMGDFALTIALPLHVYEQTDSTLAVAVVFAARFLPRVLFGSIVGVFVDRWDRKKIMVVSDVARAVFLAPLLIAPDRLEVIAPVAAIQGFIGLFFMPAENALLPKLVGKDRIVTANALNSLNDNLGFLIGPALGSALYAGAGITSVVLFDAVTFVASAWLIRLIAADARPVREAVAVAVGSAWRRMIAEWYEGLLVIRRERTLSVVFAALALAGIAEGVFLTLGLTPLVLDVLKGSPAQVGLLGAAQGVGGILGGLVIARLGHRIAKRALFGWGEIGVGIADLGSANARLFASAGTPAVAVAMGWQVVAGPTAIGIGAGRQSNLQEHTADAYRGRVFGAMGATEGLAMLVGLAMGGLLGGAVGLVPIMSAGACIRILGGALVFLLLPVGALTRPSPVAIGGTDSTM